MSRSVDFSFAFHKSINVRDVLRRFQDSGACFTFADEVAYVLDRDDMFDWKAAEVGSLGEVISQISSDDWIDATVGISMVFGEEGSGGDLIFHPGRAEVSFIVSVNPKVVNGDSKFCDAGWYLVRMIPTLESFGLSEVQYRDSE